MFLEEEAAYGYKRINETRWINCWKQTRNNRQQLSLLSDHADGWSKGIQR